MRAGKLVIVTLQENFLQLNYEQISVLAGKNLEIRAISFNKLTTAPPTSEETILYLTPGLKPMIERSYPDCATYFYAKRENLISNMGELFCLREPARILVVNDCKENTDDMIDSLEDLHLNHEFIAYYPGRPLPPDSIDIILTAGERFLIPSELQDKRIIDLGLRFISLESMFHLFDHFRIHYTPASFARKYMQEMIILAGKWQILGNNKFISSWNTSHNESTTQVTFDDFTALSPTMKKFVKHLKKIAKTEAPVHVYGETGTGKKMVSQAIHNGSSRKGQPFLLINCSTNPSEIIEKEMFGAENEERISTGLLEQNSGTVYIEEICEMNSLLQAKLVQALVEKRIVRQNGSNYIAIQPPRIISTSSKPLEKLKTFNKKLFLLLTSFNCRIPTLSERAEDFDILVANYLKSHLEPSSVAITTETLLALKNHTWEGNVQELYNVLQYMICAADGNLTREELPYYIALHENKYSPLSSVDSGATNTTSICQDIEKHGFLTESLKILELYRQGKLINTAYGRNSMQILLQQKGIKLTIQQLRLRLETLNENGLLIVRPGRGGTTISEQGEKFLQAVLK